MTGLYYTSFKLLAVKMLILVVSIKNKRTLTRTYLEQFNPWSVGLNNLQIPHILGVFDIVFVMTLLRHSEHPVKPRQSLFVSLCKPAALHGCS